MKALLTGGNGNLARLTADRLVQRDVRVIRFDRPETITGPAPAGTDIIEGDVRDVDQMEQIFSDHKPDIVYHFASLLSGSSEADLETAWNVNATASFHLMRLAVKHQVRTFFFPSTAATYGRDLPDPLDEASEQWPGTMYGATKVAVERLGVYFKLKHVLDFRCLRFPLVVSPYAPKTAVTAYPSHAFKAAVANQRFTFPVSPGTGMSSIFIEDVIEGIMRFTHTDAERLGRHAYNLHAYFVSAEMVADTVKRLIPAFQFDYRPDPTVESLLNAWPNVYLDESAREDWGWEPAFDFAKSATRMIELLKAR